MRAYPLREAPALEISSSYSPPLVEAVLSSSVTNQRDVLVVELAVPVFSAMPPHMEVSSSVVALSTPSPLHGRRAGLFALAAAAPHRAKTVLSPTGVGVDEPYPHAYLRKRELQGE